MNKRDNSMDLLRFISCIGVIFIHASSYFKSTLIYDGVFVGNPGFETVGILFFNVIPRFAVACFFMISGAFILNDRKNIDLKDFYRRIFRNILFPSFIFYVIYFLTSEVYGLIQVLKNGSSPVILFEFLVDFIAGVPSAHLWTMTVLAVIYLFVPVIIRIKERIGDVVFRKLSIIYFIFALIAAHSSYYTFYWSFGMVFDYLAYFMIGYTIRTGVKNKNPLNAGIAIASSFVCLAITLVIQYRHTLSGIQEYAETFPLIDPFSPFVCLSSLLMFYAFANIDVKTDIHHTSRYCFVIYLVHAGIIDFLVLLNNRITILPDNPVLAIGIIGIVTYALSLAFSIVFNMLLKYSRKRFYISDRIFTHLIPLIDRIEKINNRIF